MGPEIARLGEGSLGGHARTDLPTPETKRDILLDECAACRLLPL